MYSGKNYRLNIKLSEFTSFKIGGFADIYMRPESQEELQEALFYTKENRIYTILFGGGTNILLPDDGIRGAVIHTVGMKNITVHSGIKGIEIEAQAGCEVADLLDFCADEGFEGLEAFGGLPGTVGGAVFMNARCYDCSIADVVQSVSFLQDDYREIKRYDCIKADWDYKQSPFQPRGTNHGIVDAKRKIILSARFAVRKGDSSRIRQRIRQFIDDRTQKGHFTLPSAGSTFKNNRIFGKPSGKIIDEAGLQGMQIGGAQIAPWHGNFIVNTGSATAADVKTLIAAVQKTVKEKTGFRLEPEVIVIEAASKPL